MDRLYEKLVQYSSEDYYPMHMPGHKRNTKLLDMVNPYTIDITEIEGFDNLHQAEGCLKELSERIQRLYQAKRSFPLVNGSTAGILAAISAATKKGDQVLLTRNCHKSVFHATLLRELRPSYLYPERLAELSAFGGILPGQVEEMLINNPEIKLVVITSPTYEGIVSDIKEIAEVAHRYGALLLVDEAHGAHFGFHHSFPKSAVTQGADLVIQSLHKTLPAFTQTAVLHSNRSELVSKIEQYLAIYQSSSPSYLLLAGMDQCVTLLEEKQRLLFKEYDKRLKAFYELMKSLQNLQLMNRNLTGLNGIFDIDSSKIVISTRNTGITGNQLFHILSNKYHIVMEMEAKDYVLGMTSICDTEEGFTRLKEALIKIDAGLEGISAGSRNTMPELERPVQAMAPYEAMEKKTQTIKLCNSINRISAVFVSLFPPGVPVMVPGEVISETFLNYIRVAKQSEVTVTGLSGEQKDLIEVIG